MIVLGAALAAGAAQVSAQTVLEVGCAAEAHGVARARAVGVKLEGSALPPPPVTVHRLGPFVREEIFLRTGVDIYHGQEE
ncbi:MAG TPA: hypothetical protein VIV56_07255 [Gemmatimonadales bacterium]